MADAEWGVQAEQKRDREPSPVSVSPDTSRLWDNATGKKLDKDRFRRDLGGVEDAYREVMDRLERRLGSSR